MDLLEDRVPGSRGDTLFARLWEPEQPARALLLLVHGAGEHGGRYAAFAREACARRYVVAVLDQVGHGRSGGIPGYVARFDDYVDDLATFDHRVRARYPELPSVLVGHSLGGLVACHYLLRAQGRFTAAALSGPLLALDPPAGAVQRLAARVLGSLLPRLGVLKLDPAGVSRDPAVVEAYVADPLVFHGRLTARFLREMFAAMAEIAGRGGEISLPLLVQHGERDVMTAPAGSRALTAAAASPIKALRVYPGLYHEIFNEPERETVLSELFDWLDAQLSR